MTDTWHALVAWTRALFALAVLCASAASCVGGGAPTDPFALPGEMGRPEAGPEVSEDETPRTAAGSKHSHFPLIAGARWTYHHHGLQAEWDEVATLESGTYDDQPAFVLRGEDDARGEQSLSTLQIVGSTVTRVHKEDSIDGQLAWSTEYDPGFVRFDESWRVAGQSQTLMDAWSQTCFFASAAQDCAPGAMRVGSTTHIYRVKQLSTRVTVPAGTFDTIEIERENPGNLEDPGGLEIKQFWYAAGVGKVREFNPETGATEELTEYSVP